MKSFTAKMQEVMFDYDVLVTDNGYKKISDPSLSI